MFITNFECQYRMLAAKEIGAQEQGLRGHKAAPPQLALPGSWPPPPDVGSLRSPSVASGWAPEVNPYYEAEMVRMPRYHAQPGSWWEVICTHQAEALMACSIQKRIS